MKKINAYFPVWILLIMPPLLFITLSFNLLMSGVAILTILLIFDRKDLLKKITNKIFKIFGITIILDLITLILFLIPEFFYKNEFVKSNLITPLETNPYTNILSIIYVLLIAVLNILLIKKMIKKIIQKLEIDNKYKKISSLLFIFFLFPYLFFIPSNKLVKTEYNSLNDLRGTVMENKSKISTILKYLKTTEYISSYTLETRVSPYTINIYLKELSLDYKKEFEMDTAVMFNLIKDVNEINYYIGDSVYTYTLNDINDIFKNVRKLSLDDIYIRYNNDNFKEFIYLDHIKGYDVFDTSEFCQTERQFLFELDDINYYLSCSSIDKIMLYNKNNKFTIKEALENNIVTKEDILNSRIEVLMGEYSVDSSN